MTTDTKDKQAQQRRIDKAVRFGLVYGMSAARLRKLLKERRNG